jgi:hypothetical protein
MRRMNRTLAIQAAVLAAAAAVGQAQAQSQEPAAVDPAAISALQSMGTYLRTLKAFRVEAVTTNEDVLDDGQKIQTAGVTTILVRMPDRLRAEVVDDRHERLYLYDGKSFTLHARRSSMYATVPAPPTIGKLADQLQETYGFGVPLEDLFLWGSPGSSTAAIKSALDVGPGVVLGTTCEHYAFRQDDLDWQIWIQSGDYPLPRKLVITTKTDEARPQHSAVYSWNLAPSFNEAAFDFDAPAGASRVVLSKLPAAAGASK